MVWFFLNCHTLWGTYPTCGETFFVGNATDHWGPPVVPKGLLRQAWVVLEGHVMFWWNTSRFLIKVGWFPWLTNTKLSNVEGTNIFFDIFPHLPGEGCYIDFIRAVLLLRLLTRRLLLAVQIPVGTAGPQPRLPGRSGHCRTSTASSRSQCALPDLKRELQIPVGTAGPQPRAPDPSGHCRTSTATSRSQWALPDLNRDFQIAVGTAGPQPRLSDRSGHCRTSTATSRSQWALPDLNGKNVRKDVR